MMGAKVGREPASWVGRTVSPVRSKSEVTIFLGKNQGCEAKVDSREAVELALIRREKEERKESGTEGPQRIPGLFNLKKPRTAKQRRRLLEPGSLRSGVVIE